MGLGPRFTQANDMFVRFKNSESIDSYLSAIVREAEGSHVILVLARHLISAQKYIEKPIHLQIDIPSLKILTKSTPYDSYLYHAADLWQGREKHHKDFETLPSMTERESNSIKTEIYTLEFNNPKPVTESEYSKRRSLGPLV